MLFWELKLENGPSKLLLHFIKYRLDLLNNKYTKTAVNSSKQYFDSCYMKFFGAPTTKCRPCKIFVKLNRNHLLMALKSYFQTSPISDLRFTEMHKMSKIWFANNKFSLWKSLVYNYWAVQNAIFYPYFFYLPKL